MKAIIIKVVFGLLLSAGTIGCNSKIQKEKEYYSNGQLKYEKEILNGYSHGEARSFYENGALRFEGNFKNGYRVGKHVLFFKDFPNQPSEITEYEWQDTISMLKKIEFFNEKGEKTFASTFNPEINYSIEKIKCCANDSIEFSLKIEELKNESVYVRIGKLNSIFDFVGENRVIYGEGTTVTINERCKEVIEGMLFDWRMELTSDTTGVTRAEHTYFRYEPDCSNVAVSASL